MRELSSVELELVEGGNPVAVGALVLAGIAVVGGIGLMAYCVYNDCSGSLEVSSNGIKAEVTCPPKTN